MMDPTPFRGLAAAMDAALRGPPPPVHYILHLYITGATFNSAQAVANLRAFCELHLKGEYELTVTDLYQEPAAARQSQITAAPTLVKEAPPPQRRLIGNFSSPDRVRRGLGLPPDE